MEQNVYMYNGSLCSAVTENAIERPAVLIDHKSDVFLAYGEYEDVQKKFKKYTDNPRMAQIYSDLVVIALSDDMTHSDDQLSKEQICYIINRAMAFTASGFCTKLYTHCMAGDLIPWIQSEMRRLPLNLTQDPA